MRTCRVRGEDVLNLLTMTDHIGERDARKTRFRKEGARDVEAERRNWSSQSGGTRCHKISSLEAGDRSIAQLRQRQTPSTRSESNSAPVDEVSKSDEEIRSCSVDTEATLT